MQLCIQGLGLHAVLSKLIPKVNSGSSRQERTSNTPPQNGQCPHAPVESRTPTKIDEPLSSMARSDLGMLPGDGVHIVHQERWDGRDENKNHHSGQFRDGEDQGVPEGIRFGGT